MTRNGRSIILTAFLALILVYLFSIIGYLFFRDDFLLEVDGTPAKDSLDEATTLSLDLPESVLNEAHRSSLQNLTVEDIDRAGNASFCANENCTSASNGSEVRDSSVILDLVHDLKKHKKAHHAKMKADAQESEEMEEREEESSKERACDSLVMCIITTLNHGLRNGGGIGDVLRSPSSVEPLFIARVIYDLLFYFIVIIIILNLIFGVIIDTFADLRSEKQQKEEILKNTCFICGNYIQLLWFWNICYSFQLHCLGLDRSAFDNKSVSFEEHIRMQHNMWHYLKFIVLVKVKDPTEFTGPESYVASMIKVS